MSCHRNEGFNKFLGIFSFVFKFIFGMKYFVKFFVDDVKIDRSIMGLKSLQKHNCVKYSSTYTGFLYYLFKRLCVCKRTHQLSNK